MGIPTRAESAGPAIRLPAASDRDRLVERFRAVRRLSETLCEPLEPEDYVVQSMPDASPTKWHLAHTSWFFETFVLAPNLPGYRPFRPRFRLPVQLVLQRRRRADRPARSAGCSPARPSARCYRYRARVDEQVLQWLDRADDDRLRRLGAARSCWACTTSSSTRS